MTTNYAETLQISEIFHASKVEYETKLKNSGYKNFDFKNNLEKKNDNSRNRKRNIKWFNAPFCQTVLAIVAKQFLDLTDKYFQANNQLHKICNRHTVKVSYFCRPNYIIIFFHHHVSQ